MLETMKKLTEVIKLMGKKKSSQYTHAMMDRRAERSEIISAKCATQFTFRRQ